MATPASRVSRNHGRIVTAEGDDPGTNAVVAYRPAGGAIVVALASLFGRFDENEYILDTAVAAGFDALVQK